MLVRSFEMDLFTLEGRLFSKIEPNNLAYEVQRKTWKISGHVALYYPCTGKIAVSKISF